MAKGGRRGKGRSIEEEEFRDVEADTELTEYHLEGGSKISFRLHI